MRIMVVGGGFVGVTTAIVLAESGHAVQLVEVDPSRHAELSAGRPPFYEPGVKEALGPLVSSRAIRVLSGVTDSDGAEVAFLCVGTPQSGTGAADLRFIEAATRDLGAHFAGLGAPVVVVVKSTVPPGTTRDVVGPILSGYGPLGERFGLASNPEFLREGCALEDARAPDRVVVGAEDGLARERLGELYSGEDEVVYLDATSAEAVKYASNAMLATRIAFSNEIANLCEVVGVDVDAVMGAVGMDERIGPLFLKAGLGFGGSCFPKDLQALRYAGEVRGVRLGILDAVLANNETQPLRAVTMAREMLGSLEEKRVALLGLAFKSATSDVRETRALPIYRALVEAGAEVVCHDPIASEEFLELAPGARIAPDVATALTGADLCILQTEWPEYREILPEDFMRWMKTPFVVDGRRHLDAEALVAGGVRLRAVGRGDLK